MSGVYQRGIPINIVERFYAIDPITEAATLTDPTEVVFTVRYPDGDELAFTFGTDSEVTKHSDGVFICILGSDAPLPPGTYRYLVQGHGAVETENEGEFTVLESGVLDPIPVGYPTPGPCTTWINGEDVSECCDDDLGSDAFLLEDVAAMASGLLFEITGRKFSGLCERVQRPCRRGCGCWNGGSDLSVWTWNSAYGSPYGWTCEDSGRRCGCGTESRVKLPGWPIREIVEVKIDGAVLNPSGYRLEDNRYLLRLSEPGPPVVRHVWPACQDITLEDDQPGTFSVRYRYGIDPPPLGRKAAAQLACELWKACPGNSGECALPNKVTRVVRQGITIEKIVPLADFLKEGATGLQLVDAFIAEANPRGTRRPPAVMSPDLPSMGKRTG